jgi:hypothetical protein
MSACAPNDSSFFSSIVAGISGVHTGPGATEFARIPRSAWRVAGGSFLCVPGTPSPSLSSTFAKGDLDISGSPRAA